MEVSDDELRRAEQRVKERNKDGKETRRFVAYFCIACIVCIPYYALLIYCAYLLVDALP